MPSVSRPLSIGRRLTNLGFIGLSGVAAILVLAPLAAIFGYLVYKGIGSLNWAFLTNTPRPVGEAGGGMANAIIGSAMILGLGSIIGVPLGIGAGIYLAEFGSGRYVDLVRFTADVLERCSFDCRRHRGVCPGGAAAAAFLRALRRRSAWAS